MGECAPRTLTVNVIEGMQSSLDSDDHREAQRNQNKIKLEQFEKNNPQFLASLGVDEDFSREALLNILGRKQDEWNQQCGDYSAMEGRLNWRLYLDNDTIYYKVDSVKNEYASSVTNGDAVVMPEGGIPVSEGVSFSVDELMEHAQSIAGINSEKTEEQKGAADRAHKLLAQLRSS